MTLAAGEGHEAVVATLLNNNANIEAVDGVSDSDDMRTNECICAYNSLHIYMYIYMIMC